MVINYTMEAVPHIVAGTLSTVVYIVLGISPGVLFFIKKLAKNLVIF